MRCSAPDCPNDAARAGLCWTHLKRRECGRPIGQPPRLYGQPRVALQEAALALADVEAEAEQASFRRALARLFMAARRYAAGGGGRRP